MEVCIVKPDRIFFKEDAEELLLPTSTGYIGILKEHAPLVTGLDNGVLALRQGTSWKILALLGGFGVIKENRVNILCRDIEDASEIDVDEAERRVAEARTGMEKAESRKIYIENQLTFDRERARKVERFLSQPFFVAEVFTGSPGKYVSLAESIQGFTMILGGELDDLPEQAFYLVGNIDEVVEKAAKL